MPLTHDMGLIGFHLVHVRQPRAHAHLMPTELFVRRPLLWLQIAAQQRATILCSPNFGYRHFLKVLGDRSPGNLDLSSVRLIFNGAEPISVELCEEFLARLNGLGLKRNAMYPGVRPGRGLAGCQFSARGPRAAAPSSSNRHKLGIGDRPQVLADASRDALGLVSVGKVIPLLRPAHRRQRRRAAGRWHMWATSTFAAKTSPPVTSRNRPQMRKRSPPTAGCSTGDLGLILDGETYITGRAKEILFVNGQNYYPHDLEAIAQRADGMELGKVVVAGVRPPGAETDQLTVFALYRGDLARVSRAGHRRSRA